MEFDGLSDVDVLDDLLHDVDGEGDTFEDAEAFFDTDLDQDSEELGDINADDILSQLDAVTSLDEDDEQPDEFHDSTSVPHCPQLSQSDESRVMGESSSIDEDVEERHERALQIPEETSLFSGKAVVQAVLDLLTNTSDEDTKEDEELQLQQEIHESETPTSTLGIISPSLKEELQNESQGMPPVHEATNETSDSIVLPPPAPTTFPVIVGSMNPVEEDDSDESDESQGEDDDEKTSVLPPLQLNIPEDDDDVLEIDAAVVSRLQSEDKSKREEQSLTTKQLDTNFELENAPFKTLSGSTDDPYAVDCSFHEEIRVAHVTTTLEPSSPFSDIHKLAGGSTLSANATFGISYQNMRKKVDESHADDDIGVYSLSSGPSFPDEREFESEMELTSDVSFSVATIRENCGKVCEYPDDEEFSFHEKPKNESILLSEDVLKARRNSLETQKRKEEEELVRELKRVTDEEKKLVQSTKTMSDPSETATESEAIVEKDALSLTELHSIYKRGLGDQEVLMDEEDEKNTEAPAVGRSMSVMGRLFSQQGTTETIEEEADDDDTEGERDVPDSHDEDAHTITEQSDVDESAEWREIKLVQHRQSQDENSSTGNRPEALISYAQAAGYYAETPDVLQHSDLIEPEDFPRGSCLTCLSRPRLTFTGAIEERDRVFCIAATAFDAHNEILVRVLQTIYKKITKSPRDVLLMGRHWEDVGFQGTDPSTDLRGCGVLSLLQLLYLVETFPDLTQRLHVLSQHPTRHFPLACVLINITLLSVVALRSGVLYPECNKHSSVLSGMNRLYVALASQLHDAIQSRPDEIPLILKDTLERGRSNPSKLIDEALDGNSLRPSRPAAATRSSKVKASEPDKLEFTEIGLHSVDEDE